MILACVIELSLCANPSMKNHAESEKISERFRAFRKAAGLTQADLGNLLNTHSNYISQIEREEKTPSARLLKDFTVLEMAPTYRTKSDKSDRPDFAQKSMFPQQYPQVVREDPLGVETPSPHELADAISAMSELFKRNPKGFRSVMEVIKTINESARR